MGALVTQGARVARGREPAALLVGADSFLDSFSLCFVHSRHEPRTMMPPCTTAGAAEGRRPPDQQEGLRGSGPPQSGRSLPGTVPWDSSN